MTDRDTFAMAALTGILARGAWVSSECAAEAYLHADAMIRKRGAAPLPTLTDEEREAVLNAARAYELDSDEEECAKIADTLRKLLERME